MKLIALLAALMSTAHAQSASRAIFAGPEFDSPQLCVGRGFVAMIRYGNRQPLVVVVVGNKGIEAPINVPIEGDEVFGMQCAGSHIELLVRQTAADHFSVLPFRFTQNILLRDAREEIDYSLAAKGPQPPAIERRISEFHRPELNPLGLLGDWYVEVMVDRPGYAYSVHFVHTEVRSGRELAIKLEVDFLEQTLDRLPFSMRDAKVTRSVPLIRQQTTVRGGG